MITHGPHLSFSKPLALAVGGETAICFKAHRGGVMKCVNPNAPIVPCVVCGAKVHTCEREKAVKESYLCPVHPSGAALTGSRWVCSNKCWEIAVEGGETP
jgi:hypothetical protein